MRSPVEVKPSLAHDHLSNQLHQHNLKFPDLHAYLESGNTDKERKKEIEPKAVRLSLSYIRTRLDLYCDSARQTLGKYIDTVRVVCSLTHDDNR